MHGLFFVKNGFSRNGGTMKNEIQVSEFYFLIEEKRLIEFHKFDESSCFITKGKFKILLI